MEYNYQVHYHHACTGAAGFMIVHTAAKAATEKIRLEGLGYTVSGIVPPAAPRFA
jgi:hypothetical protein